MGRSSAPERLARLVTAAGFAMSGGRRLTGGLRLPVTCGAGVVRDRHLVAGVRT